MCSARGERSLIVPGARSATNDNTILTIYDSILIVVVLGLWHEEN